MEGKGMGLALAAELNNYPGPMHVLEHAQALGLNETQRSSTAQLMATHKDEVPSPHARSTRPRSRPVCSASAPCRRPSATRTCKPICGRPRC
jgi:hypothetical protein